MKITATIITLNEERNIKRCIQSLIGVADEIIVLDSFSSDQTKEICSGLGVRFIEREWEGYAASKNYLNSLASNDYILSIDADEELDSELRSSILEVKKQSSGNYSVNRLTNYCGKWIRHSGWYPDIKTRLFPKEGSKWEGEYVHETLSTSDEAPLVLLEGHLNHYSYYSYKEHRQRADKYSKLTAQKMFAAGKRASALKPLLSAVARFISMFILKLGFLDGKMGYKIALISAKSNVYKYKELRKLNNGSGKPE